MNKALDVTRQGRRDYTLGQEYQVVEAILSRGPDAPITVARLAEVLGMDGRTVRQIVSDNDGVAYLLGGGDEGYYACPFADDGEEMTARLANQAATLRARVDRRIMYADAQMARRQGRMFA